MGATCCNYADKDKNNENFDPAKLVKGKNIMCSKVNPQKLIEVTAIAKKHLNKLIKIQALARGYLIRNKKKPAVPVSELENKILSSRSKK